jgi:hypothetical protein
LCRLLYRRRVHSANLQLCRLWKVADLVSSLYRYGLIEQRINIDSNQFALQIG